MRKIETTKSDIDLERNKLCRYIDNTNYSYETKKNLKSLLEVMMAHKEGDICISFDDIKYIFDLGGKVYCGVGKYEGNDSVNIAIKRAIKNASLKLISIGKINRILIHFIVHSDLPIKYISEAMESIYEISDKNSSIIFGVTNDKLVAKNYTQVAILLAK